MILIKGLLEVIEAVRQYPVRLGLAAIAIQLVYLIVLGIYRIYFHPLNIFPGPKLAALTYWYETYYNLLKSPGGQFMFQYRRLHEQYGPIIRISPNEVHIQDSSFFDEMFSQNLHWDKPDHLQYRFSNATGTFPTPKHEIHRRRRAAINPFFSKQRIGEVSWIMQEQLNALCTRLRKEYQGTDQVLRLDWMWGCITSDSIVRYCFDQSYGFLDAPDFKSPFVQAMIDLLDGVHLVTQFPWVMSILNALPESLVALIQPGMKSVHGFNHQMEYQITEVLADRKAGKKPERTVFHALLESDLPPEDLSSMRLQHEAISVVGAGIETTKWALSVGGFHIINNPRLYRRLREELESAIPDPKNIPPLKELERLPYLTACIQESIRLSYGTAQRSPRVSQTFDLPYKSSYVIPRGSIVSIDNYAISHDEAIFPDSHEFQPERWLGDPVAPDGKKLVRYLVSFGKGTRSCLGINLAYAEMYIAMANVYRNFEFELFQTDRTAVDCFKEMFVPHPKPGTLGVRAKVK
ncbi:hypothetical protein N8T08_007113 [Aspergillus melleus]|uniref:Uncharacterized protein n=1 Tax=Aspergillus melleus TaxID=138277 RepID=A0ACC3AYR4_9EURO|nr:hypothetical protein N8T08_007113 [Aspergillus melleus]